MNKVQVTEKFLKDLIELCSDFADDLEADCDCSDTMRRIGRSEYLIDLLKDELTNQQPEQIFNSIFKEVTTDASK